MRARPVMALRVRVRPMTDRKRGVRAGTGLKVRVRPVTVRKGGVTPTVYKGVVRAGTSL